MTRSTKPSEVEIPKSYYRLKGNELRHRAGIAWAQGKDRLARAIEQLAATVNPGYRPGQHGTSYDWKPTAYPTTLEYCISMRGGHAGRSDD